jgi:hypothetical protein
VGCPASLTKELLPSLPFAAPAELAAKHGLGVGDHLPLRELAQQLIGNQEGLRRMSHPQKQAKLRKIVLDNILAFVALALSVFSLFVSHAAEQDVSRIEAVKTEYGLFHDLALQQLEHPEMAHLFANTGETYDARVAAIRATIPHISAEDRAKLLLQERALAHYIFTSYEETFYLWKQASQGEPGRSVFLQDDLEYFNEFLCGNPRLLWFWDIKEGDKLAQSFAPDLQNYYRDNVAKECATPKDPQGPLLIKEKASQ